MELISAYTHCPICGSAEYRLESPGQRHCKACGFRDFNNVIVAVAAMILDENGRLLLIRRAKDPAKGMLAPPGGFVDAGECLESAIHREIAEETGLTLTSLSYLTSHPNQYTYCGRTRPVCDVFFIARTESFEIVLDGDEVTGWQFRPLSEVDPSELAFDSMRHALAMLRSRHKQDELLTSKKRHEW